MVESSGASRKTEERIARVSAELSTRCGSLAREIAADPARRAPQPGVVRGGAPGSRILGAA